MVGQTHVPTLLEKAELYCAGLVVIHGSFMMKSSRSIQNSPIGVGMSCYTHVGAQELNVIPPSSGGYTTMYGRASLTR